MTDSIIIAIDGPAGSGKSTVAKNLAQQLKIEYLDSGAIYRTLTFYGLQTFDRVEGNEDQIATYFIDHPERLKISYDNLAQTMWLSGKNVSNDIRTPAVTNQLKFVPDNPKCRQVVNDIMRDLALRYSIVIDGRDIGTIVFPDTPYKFYLDANQVTRTRRRALEMGIPIEGEAFDNLLLSIQKRDQTDMAREIAPLKKADDATYIDTTNLTVTEVISTIREKLGF